jgi:hypothetical protein
VYQQFDRDAVCALLGLTPADAPAGLILHGVYDMPSHVRQWRDRLANARVAGQAFNVVVGEYRGATIWYAPVLGAPLAAFVTHCAAMLGVRGMIQIGSFGGTQKGWEVGELLLASGAERGEAASDWYLPAGTLPSPPARSRAVARRPAGAGRELARGHGVYHPGAFMAERWEDILRWRRRPLRRGNGAGHHLCRGGPLWRAQRRPDLPAGQPDRRAPSAAQQRRRPSSHAESRCLIEEVALEVAAAQ